MNIEIIPNWHPIFVHFTVGLLSVSTLLYLAALVLRKENLLIVARWNLWIGAAITVGTVLAGLYAYNTVAHDGPSHAAMTDHRNWALPTAGVFMALALWAAWRQRGTKIVSPVFVAVMLLASGLLAVTGCKGGEAVYRYGIGVMRMPEVHGDGGHESHTHGNMPAHHQEMENPDDQSQDHHDHGDHHHQPQNKGENL